MFTVIVLLALYCVPSHFIHCAAAGAGVLKDTTFYDLLQVQPDASSLQIKLAFDRISAEYHPKIYFVHWKEATRLTDILNKVLQILLDPHRRTTYDTDGPEFPVDLNLNSSTSIIR